MNINAQVAEMLQADPSLTPEDIAKALKVSIRKANSAFKAASIDAEPISEFDKRDEILNELQIEEAEAKNAQLAAAHWEQAAIAKEEELARITGSNSSQAGIYEVPATRGSQSETIPLLLLSDWFIDTEVKSLQVMGLNEYNKNISKQRGDDVIRKAVKLWELRRRTGTKIETGVVWLGGGFISARPGERYTGQFTTPAEAAKVATDRLYSAIQFILKHGNLKHLIIPCTAGGITENPTKAEMGKGNPYEWCIYNRLAELFKNDKRVVFFAPRGQHVQINVFGKLIRFSYGDSINYRDGVGGLTIPLRKRINAWNVAREAFLDCFGRWKTYMPGRIFVGNGSLIGYTPAAQASGVEFEKPMQSLIYIEKKYGVASYEPIFVS